MDINEETLEKIYRKFEERHNTTLLPDTKVALREWLFKVEGEVGNSSDALKLYDWHRLLPYVIELAAIMIKNDIKLKAWEQTKAGLKLE